jgi:polar amino acid transport system substrate-binding protein
MQKFRIKFFIYYPVFFLIFFLGFHAAVSGQAMDSIPFKTDTSTLKVGLAGSSPFIVKTNDHFEGISYEIWEALAAQSTWKYNTQYFNSVPDGITSLQNGVIDVLVGPVSITSDRAKEVRFSQPYFQSSLSIMSNSDRHGLWERISPFFSPKLFIAVLIFLFILSIVGTLVWLAERKTSPEQFPMEPAKGIANGMWLAIVTMTTTGYGDRAPVTFWGRIITGSWMIISIIFATTMVAGIASTLTLTGIQTNVISNMEQLSGKKVAVIKSSPAKDFVEEYFGRPVEVDNLEEAYDKLKNKDVSAVVYDRPQMMYFLKKHGEKEMKVSKAEYYKQGYGFAVRTNSPLSRKINILLLNLSEQNRITRIVQAWLGDENKDM